MDVHMGNECTNSNGLGEGNEENMNMVEIIKKFQKDVQSKKDDNERLINPRSSRKTST